MQYLIDLYNQKNLDMLLYHAKRLDCAFENASEVIKNERKDWIKLKKDLSRLAWRMAFAAFIIGILIGRFVL